MSEAAKTPPPAAAPARAQFKPLNKVENLAELFKHPDFAARIASAAPKHFNAERLLRTMVLATQKTPKLLEVSPMQMLGACITLAALGLEPNTPLQHAHLIPFEVTKWNPATKNRDYIRTDVQVIIGYQGYLDLIYRSGQVESVDCKVYYQDEVDSGAFSYEYGSNKHLHHKPDDKVRAPNEEPAGAYMYAKLKSGGEVFEVMPAAKIHQMRARSQGYRTAMRAYDSAVESNKDPLKDKRYTEAPWIKDPESMWRKTPLRAGQKWLPKSIELAAALAADERPIDFTQITSGDMVLEGTFAVEEDAEPGEEAPGTKTASPAPTEPAREAVAEKPRQTRTTKAAKEPPAPAKPAAEPAHDIEGEIVYPLFNYLAEEDDGPFGPTKNAVDFALDFQQSWNTTLPEHRRALMEANADCITEAMNRDPQANTILQPFVIEMAPKDPAPSPETENFSEEKFEISRTKTPAGAWDVVAWTNKAKAMMSKFTDVSQFAGLYQVNEATIKSLPATARTILDNYREDRMKALAATEPQDDDMPDYSDVPMPDEEEPPAAIDEWQAMHDKFSADFASVGSLGDLSEIARNAAVKVQLRKLQETRPDLAESLNQKYRAREVELRG
jgi:recombination protein RecT